MKIQVIDFFLFVGKDSFIGNIILVNRKPEKYFKTKG